MVENTKTCGHPDNPSDDLDEVYGTPHKSCYYCSLEHYQRIKEWLKQEQKTKESSYT